MQIDGDARREVAQARAFRFHELTAHTPRHGADDKGHPHADVGGAAADAQSTGETEARKTDVRVSILDGQCRVERQVARIEDGGRREDVEADWRGRIGAGHEVLRTGRVG